MFVTKSSNHVRRSCNLFRSNTKRFDFSTSFLSNNPKFTKLSSKSDDVYVISTSTRGIGFEFTKQLLERSDGQVVALYRSAQSQDLNQLLVNYPSRISLMKVDLENQQSIDEISKLLKEKYSKISLLINVAGILGDGITTPGPERSIEKIERSWLEKSFEVK